MSGEADNDLLHSSLHMYWRDEWSLPKDEEEWRHQGKVRRGVVEEGVELLRRSSQGETM